MACTGTTDVGLKACTFTLLLLVSLLPHQSVAADQGGVDESDFTDVTDPKHLSYIIGHFQHQLSRLNVHSNITNCDHVIEVSSSIGHDYSFGGSCAISNGGESPRVLMCDDNMVGKFTVRGSDAHTRKEVARFIQSSCPPGG
jgi:hypothetical protein